MKTTSIQTLAKILNALVDTAERATDLENVYNDTTGESFDWDTVKLAQKELNEVSEESLRD